MTFSWSWNWSDCARFTGGCPGKQGQKSYSSRLCGTTHAERSAWLGWSTATATQTTEQHAKHSGNTWATDASYRAGRADAVSQEILTRTLGLAGWCCDDTSRR